MGGTHAGVAFRKGPQSYLSPEQRSMCDSGKGRKAWGGGGGVYITRSCQPQGVSGTWWPSAITQHVSFCICRTLGTLLCLFPQMLNSPTERLSSTALALANKLGKGFDYLEFDFTLVVLRVHFFFSAQTSQMAKATKFFPMI